MLNGLLNGKGTNKASISKLTMIVGLIVSSAVIMFQTYKSGLSYDLFTIYIMATLGANSVNKAISIYGQVEQTKKGKDSNE